MALIEIVRLFCTVIELYQVIYRKSLTLTNSTAFATPLGWSNKNFAEIFDIRKPWAIAWRCLRNSTFSRFATMPACDRRTNRHDDDSIYRASIASSGKIRKDHKGAMWTVDFYITGWSWKQQHNWIIVKLRPQTDQCLYFYAFKNTDILHHSVFKIHIFEVRLVMIILSSIRKFKCNIDYRKQLTVEGDG